MRELCVGSNLLHCSCSTPFLRHSVNGNLLNVINFPSPLSSILFLLPRKSIAFSLSSDYRVSHLVADLGWVDLDLGSSAGCWAAIVATYYPGRVVEHSKSKLTQPRYSTTRVTLYDA